MISQLFDQILMEETKARAYHLTAVIAYYGKHYSTFCYHGKHQEWVYLDDANVRKVSVTHNSYCFLIWGYYILNPTISSLLFVMWSQVGKKWSDVKELFKKGHYQPLLLLYTCPSATPIDASTALTTDIGECYHYCVVLCCMAWETSFKDNLFQEDTHLFTYLCKAGTFVMETWYPVPWGFVSVLSILCALNREIGNRFSVVRPNSCRAMCIENLGWWVVINASYCVKHSQHM